MNQQAHTLKKTLEQIRQSKGLPFNYKYLNILYSLESVDKNEIEIVRMTSVQRYQSTAVQILRHHKPISKIVDASTLK